MESVVWRSLAHLCAIVPEHDLRACFEVGPKLDFGRFAPFFSFFVRLRVCLTDSFES